jgi:hypothetical protein
MTQPIESRLRRYSFGPSRRVWGVVLGATLIGAALRVLAARDGFWLDEIWSYLYARDITSLAEVLTKFRVDNNHPLNTLWIWLAGDRLWWPVYRIPAVVCGVVTIGLAAAWLARARRGRAASIVGAAMFALSFSMLVYSSEARGYGPAVCFAMLCLLAADRASAPQSTASRRLTWSAVFGLFAMLGMLAHLTFIPFYLATVAWTAWRAIRSGQSRPLVRLIGLHGGPSLFLIVYYFSFIRGMTVGGAPPVSMTTALADALAMTCGVSSGAPPFARLIVAVVLLAFAIAFIVRLARRGDDRWVLFACGMFLCPLAFLFVRGLSSGSAYDFVYPRYFLIPLALLLLAASETLGEMLGQSLAAVKVGAALVLALWCIGNVTEDVWFLRAGRGDYLDAMRYMFERTPGPVMSVTSDNHYRAKMLVAFYARYLPSSAHIRYIDSADPRSPDASALPQWLIVHAYDPNVAPAETIDLGFGVRFRLERTFPSYGPSGWGWNLYRLESAERR